MIRNKGGASAVQKGLEEKRRSDRKYEDDEGAK